MNIEALIRSLPRVRLANLPTPLEKMPHLSAMLGGPSIWIKRDDLTGLAFGGSKVRALELTLGDAISKGADTILTMGEPQSNHARLTAAAARKLGLKVVLVIVGDAKRQRYEGNMLLCDILGADVKFAGWSEYNKVVEQTVKELEDGGRVPYCLPFGGSSPIGTIAYINAAFELHAQAINMGLGIDHIIHATASGGLQTGLAIGNRILGMGAKVIGVASTVNSSKLVMEKYLQISSDICGVLKTHLICAAEDLSLVDHFSEQSHNLAVDDKKIMNAITLVAKTEGILLDPEYTGKAMAVLIEMVRQNKFDRKDNIVFVHTGGTPALFVQPPVRPFANPPFLIRLYKEYGRKYKLVRWFRNIFPVSA